MAKNEMMLLKVLITKIKSLWEKKSSKNKNVSAEIWNGAQSPTV